MEIPKNLKDEIWDYCRVNNISNIDEFTLKLLKQGFTVEKFGATPEPRKTIEEKIVEKIVEKRVEVPVEKIVEKIVEVQVPMIDSELSERLKNQIALYEKTKAELLKSLDISEQLRKELEIEKNKGKRDLYGEK